MANAILATFSPEDIKRFGEARFRQLMDAITPALSVWAGEAVCWQPVEGGYLVCGSSRPEPQRFMLRIGEKMPPWFADALLGGRLVPIISDSPNMWGQSGVRLPDGSAAGLGDTVCFGADGSLWVEAA